MNVLLTVSILSFFLKGIISNEIKDSPMDQIFAEGCWSNNHKHCNHPLVKKSCNSIFLPHGEDNSMCEASLWSPCDGLNVRCCGKSKCQMNKPVNLPEIFEKDDWKMYDDDDYEFEDDNLTEMFEEDDCNMYGDDDYEFEDDWEMDGDHFNEDIDDEHDIYDIYQHDGEPNNDHNDEYEENYNPFEFENVINDGNNSNNEHEMYNESGIYSQQAREQEIYKGEEDKDYYYYYYYDDDEDDDYESHYDSRILMGQCVPESDYVEPESETTLIPTSSPTVYPSNYPSISTTFNCEDSSDFVVINKKQRSCSWIGFSDTRKDRHCRKSRVRKLCPKTCDDCSNSIV